MTPGGLVSAAYEAVFERDTRLRRAFVAQTSHLHKAAFRGTLVAYPLFAAAAWAITGTRRRLGLKPRVLWGPTPILTIAESSELLRRLGYRSTTLVYTTYHIRSDFDLNLQRQIQNPAVGYWLPNALFLWSLLRFDVFHFFYDGGIWSGMNIVPQARAFELPLLRLAGRRVIASAYGADVRIRDLNERWEKVNICIECPEPGKYCVCSSNGLLRIKHYRDWCNEVLAMGDMSDFVFDSRTDVNYWPIDVGAVAAVIPSGDRSPVRVVHSPNHRYFKGTRYIEQAVESLRERGYDVELDLVEGVPNDEARRRYAEADIVFAQCLAGWIGYTELEAMAAGKPVIGYIRNPRYLEHFPGCPLVNATPGTLEAKLEQLVSSAALRRELGQAGREYVEREWSYEALAPRYDALHDQVWSANGLANTLVRKWRDVYLGESRYRVARNLTGVRLDEWVIWSDPDLNLRRIEAGVYGQPPLDESGIPRMWYGGRYVEDPGVVALYALSAFHRALANPGPDDAEMRFLVAARWLRDQLRVDEQGVGRWEYPFEAIGRDLPVPWVSCLGQSLGLSILLRAEQRGGDEGFATAATAAARLLRVPLSDNGVLFEQDGLVFLEEYPEPDPAHALNGFMTGMFGLHEYHRARGEPWAHELFVRCVETVRLRLPEYEARAGLRYDLGSDAVVSTDDYYYLVQQLRALGRLTGDSFFDQWARRWARKLYVGKLRSVLRGEYV
jgi:glycosyltransferase involved in cell wall biosynthesis